MTSYVVYFFFFKQKTAYEMRISDWSSDVCSSDLINAQITRQCNDHGRHNDSDGVVCDHFRQQHRQCINGKDQSPRGYVTQQGRQCVDNQLNATGLLQAKTYSQHPEDEDENKIGRASCRERVCKYG